MLDMLEEGAMLAREEPARHESGGDTPTGHRPHAGEI